MLCFLLCLENRDDLDREKSTKADEVPEVPCHAGAPDRRNRFDVLFRVATTIRRRDERDVFLPIKDSLADRCGFRFIRIGLQTVEKAFRGGP